MTASTNCKNPCHKSGLLGRDEELSPFTSAKLRTVFVNFAPEWPAVTFRHPFFNWSTCQRHEIQKVFIRLD